MGKDDEKKRGERKRGEKKRGEEKRDDKKERAEMIDPDNSSCQSRNSNSPYPIPRRGLQRLSGRIELLEKSVEVLVKDK